MHPVYSYIKQSLSGIYPTGEAAALAKWILVDAFGVPALDLYSGKDINFSKDSYERLEDILHRLKEYEPLQYILGKTSFCGIELEVGKEVLVPRPETEELVAWILDDCRMKTGLHVLDVGTGSGCIAIALALGLDAAQVMAWDKSPGALAVARRNVARSGANVRVSQVDILSPSIPQIQVDVLVSNPPYIMQKEKDSMCKNVLLWEPHPALFVPDDDPLLFYRRIAELGIEMLRPQGVLYYEINRLFGEQTVDLLDRLGYSHIELRRDLSGNDRMVKAVRP